MITANKGMTKIAGTNMDIIYEFNNIIDALLKDSPEIVLGAITARSTALEETLKSVNKLRLHIATDLSEEIVKLDESEDDND